MFLIETIYPADADSSSLDFKLVRFAREWRREAMLHPRLEARTQGYFATNPDHDTAKSNAERAELRRRLTEIEEKLVGLGIPKGAIYRVGVTQSSLSGGQIVLTNGSALDMSMPYFTPKVALAPYVFGPQPATGEPLGPTSGLPGTRPTWDDAQDTEVDVTLDPKAKEIKTEVSVTFKTKGVPGVDSVTVVVALGPDGRLAETGAELKLFKKKIAERWAAGIITDVQFAVKATMGYDLSKSEFEAKMKALLSADIGVPNTNLRFGVEASVYSDIAGKPGYGLNFTLFKF